MFEHNALSQNGYGLYDHMIDTPLFLSDANPFFSPRSHTHSRRVRAGLSEMIHTCMTNLQGTPFTLWNNWHKASDRGAQATLLTLTCNRVACVLVGYNPPRIKKERESALPARAPRLLMQSPSVQDAKYHRFRLSAENPKACTAVSRAGGFRVLIPRLSNSPFPRL